MFEDKFEIEPNSGCWLWTGYIANTGYAGIKIKGKRHSVARMMYGKPIPKGMHLDHLCKTRCCVNPSHLEVVTHKENILRGISPIAVNSRKTHCIHGHPFSGENLSMRKGKYERICKTCRREASNRWYAKNHGTGA